MLYEMLEQFENVGGAEKLGPTTSMMLISIWRKCEKLGGNNTFSVSYRELMVLSGITKINDFNHALNRLVHFGYIRYKYDRIENISFHLNMNLQQPFVSVKKDISRNYKDVLEALEQVYIQLRNSGFFVSPIEYAEMVKIAENTGITVEQATEWLTECFEQYTPKHPEDSIRSFKYCAIYLMNKWASEQAKNGEVIEDGRNSRCDGKINKTTRREKPRTFNIIEERREELRKQGHFSRMADIKYNF